VAGGNYSAVANKQDYLARSPMAIQQSHNSSATWRGSISLEILPVDSAPKAVQVQIVKDVKGKAKNEHQTQENPYLG